MPNLSLLGNRERYEADLAQRRYLKVDPENRLVASVLEAEWNTKLRELEEARAIEEQYKQSDQPDCQCRGTC